MRRWRSIVGRWKNIVFIRVFAIHSFIVVGFGNKQFLLLKLPVVVSTKILILKQCENLVIFLNDLPPFSSLFQHFR